MRRVMEAPVGPSVADSVDRFVVSLDALRLPGRARGILVGASGGADSTALACLVALARERIPALPPIWLGHVHHGIRGSDADRDAGAVAELAARLGLDHLEERVDVPALARNEHLSIEAAGRQARYGVFSSWSEAHAIDVFLLGHHADDQVETIIQRRLDGAGFLHRGGMPRQRPLKSHQSGRFPAVARPLLAWRKSELLELLRLLDQGFCEDRTNRDLGLRRNQIRHVLLPALRNEGPGPVEPGILLRARRDFVAARATRRRAHRALVAARRPSDLEPVVLSAERLRSLSPLVLRCVLEETAARFGEPRVYREAAAHLHRALEHRGLAHKTSTQHTIEAGPRLVINFVDDRVALRPSLEAVSPVPAALALAEPIAQTQADIPERVVVWGPWEIRLTSLAALPPDSILRTASPWVAYIDRDQTKGGLDVRGRRPGDRFRPLGCSGSKKLKEFLREQQVPRCERDRWPLIVDADSIVWPAGLRVGESHRLGATTRRAVLLEARRLE